MDFLLSTGIRKMPKIPDKSNSYSFYSKKPSKKEFTSTLHDHHEDEIRLTTEKVNSVKIYNLKKHGNSDIKYHKKMV